MAVESARDFLIDELRDIYNAEKQLTRALPKLAKAASAPSLQDAFRKHLEETKGQVERLDRIFEELGVRGTGKKCEAMEGLVEEGNQLVQEIESSEVLDAALIAAAQKVEHYEIASYGTLRTLAEGMGLDNVARLLEETLEEEKATDEALTELAESEVNQRMFDAEGGEEEEEEEEQPKRRAAGGRRR
jgi:ferritin-like metal-binding protein YciE